jgi:hypothetical protein
MMGNVVVWKPSDSQIFSAQIIIEVFKEAGVPDGVINVVLEPGMITDTVWQVVILRESTLQDRLMSLKIFGLKLELTSITINIPRIVGEERFYYRSLKC